MLANLHTYTHTRALLGRQDPVVCVVHMWDPIGTEDPVLIVICSMRYLVIS